MATPAAPLITNSAQLLTSISEIQKGFLFQARLKRQVSLEYVDKAIAFVNALNQTNSTANPEVVKGLLAAAGFSQKAIGHLQAGGRLSAELIRFLNEVKVRRGTLWQTEVGYRYMFTTGDTIGGAMRNLIGLRAKRRLGRFLWRTIKAAHPTAEKTVKDGEIKAIKWPNRVLWFDRKSPLIRKNIDLLLLQGEAGLKNLQDYLACGELKGGIDPAGADEHWKTALTALERIKRQEKPDLRLFFVGGVIDQTLANDIFSRLQDGRLDRAANLTIRPQLADLSAWIANL